jgi:hypothetical protein
MKRIVLALVLIVSNKAMAEGALHAHEHGSIDFEVAVEGKTADFEMSGPAESFIGFEHVAKTAKEKKALVDATNMWNTKFFELISFDKSLNCKTSGASFEQKMEKGNHSEIAAAIKVSCEKDLKGAKVSVNLRSHFKNIKNLKMEIIGNESKTIKITKANMEVNL